MKHSVWNRKVFSFFVFISEKTIFIFADRKEQSYEIEIIPSNGQNGFKKKSTHLIDVSRIPKINVISPDGGARKVRSQSVGNRVTLKQTNNNDATDDTRSFFSESLLHNISNGKRFTSLDNVHRHSTGTLARPHIFYQGPLSNIPHYRSHSELSTVLENSSNGQINEDDVSIRFQLYSLIYLFNIHSNVFCSHLQGM